MDEVLEPLILENAEQFYEDAAARILLAASDVFGPDSSVVDALRRAYSQGSIDTIGLSEIVILDQVKLVEPEKSGRLAALLAHELLRIHNCHVDYFLQENLAGFWADLETAGMSHADIGRYFERYNS